MTKALEIINFTKTYDDEYVAVNRLNLVIQQGEFFGLLGPNGAGKSTTINSICGINRFDEGKILVFGNDVNKNPVAAKRLIGISPQDFNADIFLSVKKILYFYGGYFGLSAKERKKKIPEILDFFNLREHAHKRFNQLSGGLKRRVMLARAILCDPKLLILDEPTAALDIELRYELWNLVKKLNEEGITIILTSHYIEEIERLCRTVGIINKGRMLFYGSIEECMEGYPTLEEAYRSRLEQDTH